MDNNDNYDIPLFLNSSQISVGWGVLCDDVEKLDLLLLLSILVCFCIIDDDDDDDDVAAAAFQWNLGLLLSSIFNNLLDITSAFFATAESEIMNSSTDARAICLIFCYDYDWKDNIESYNDTWYIPYKLHIHSLSCTS